MAGSIKRVRETMEIKPTQRNKGLQTTLRVVAYDNGMIEVNGVPINAAPAYDQGVGWLGAHVIIGQHMEELQKQSSKRRSQPKV